MIVSFAHSIVESISSQTKTPIDWNTIFLGALVGALLAEVLSFVVAYFLLRRFFDRRDLVEKKNIRKFGFARLYEITGKLLIRTLPLDRFARKSGLREFDGVFSQEYLCYSKELTDAIESNDIIHMLLLDVKNENAVIYGQLQNDIDGYMQEIERIVSGFGSFLSNTEYHDLIELQQSISSFSRKIKNGNYQLLSRMTDDESASYIWLIYSCVKIRELMKGLSKSEISAINRNETLQKLKRAHRSKKSYYDTHY